jgi:signal transduction histidine kinase
LFRGHDSSPEVPETSIQEIATKSKEADTLLRAEQIRSTYSHLPLTLSISVANSFLVGFVLTPVASFEIIVIWIGLIIAQSLLRIIARFLYFRADVRTQDSPWWGRAQAVGAGCSGILWGCAPLLFGQLDDAHLLFVTLVIGGMCAGAATVDSAYSPIVAAFLVPALVPLAAKFLLAGDRPHATAGVLVCIFGVSLFAASQTFRRWFSETTMARVELNQANARLSNEISSRRSAEAKLHQLQKLEAIGRLTAGIAHDFNNLLMSISGSVGLITMRIASQSGCAPYIATIREAVERGTNLTRRLLAFGRKQSLSPRNVDINETLRGLEKLLHTTLGGYGYLVLKLDQRPVVAFVDGGEFENAVFNLVINARDAMPDGGVVTITTRNVELAGSETGTEGLRGKFAKIAVSDTGAGMSDAVRLQAFDPFFTTKGVGEGSGLGLSQVYGLMRQSGGTTEIESRIGQGTTVTMYLPQGAGDVAPQQSSQGESPVAASKGLCVLLLDDDAQVRQTLTAILDEAGYSVTSLGVAQDALALVRSSKPIDAIVVDFAMPDMRGDQFAGEARSVRPGVPILFITGYADREFFDSEPWVLRKPFTAENLIRTIEQATHVAA